MDLARIWNGFQYFPINLQKILVVIDQQDLRLWLACVTAHNFDKSVSDSLETALFAVWLSDHGSRLQELCHPVRRQDSAVNTEAGQGGERFELTN